MTDKNKLLRELRSPWQIESIDSDVTGYWTKDDNLMDLSDLQIDYDSAEEYQAYLEVSPSNTIIRIKGDESYYEVERFENSSLMLTCFFKNKDMLDHIKLATFNLNRK